MVETKRAERCCGGNELILTVVSKGVGEPDPGIAEVLEHIQDLGQPSET